MEFWNLMVYHHYSSHIRFSSLRDFYEGLCGQEILHERTFMHTHTNQPTNQPTNNYVTSSIYQSPSSEANSHSASQDISHLLRNPKFHYHVHKSPTPLKSCVTFHNKLGFYSQGLLAPCPTPKFEYYPLSAV
jgi:hypothetical protein